MQISHSSAPIENRRPMAKMLRLGIIQPNALSRRAQVCVFGGNVDVSIWAFGLKEGYGQE